VQKQTFESQVTAKGKHSGSRYANSRDGRRGWQRDSLLDILARFIHLEAIEADIAGKKARKENMIFPRYHQLDAVRKIEKTSKAEGAGNNYLVMHFTTLPGQESAPNQRLKKELYQDETGADRRARIALHALATDHHKPALIATVSTSSIQFICRSVNGPIHSSFSTSITAASPPG
jgi:hypothetical protein